MLQQNRAGCIYTFAFLHFLVIVALKSIINNSALFVGIIVKPEGLVTVSFIHGSQNAS